MEEYELATRVIESLQSDGHEAMIVGGYCRDLLRAETSKDIDIATSAKPEEILNKKIEGVDFVPIEAREAMPVVKALSNGLGVEVATYRKDIYEPGTPESRVPKKMDYDATILDDAQRRDLTINALYFDPITDQLVDPTESGLDDVNDGVIRFVGDPRQRILEDRVRILRAVRFKNSLGYKYTEETESALKEFASEVENIRSKDRILVELMKMLNKPTRAEAIQDLDDLGILEHLIPEFTGGKKVEQSPNHHSEGNVFNHQMLVLRNLPDNASEHLVMAAMLHDLGKQFTAQEGEDGTIHFYGHEEVSVELARKILNRFRMKKEDMHAVLWLIKNHMRVRQFLDMRRSTQLNMLMPHLYDPDLKREGLFDDLVSLLEVDSASSLNPEGGTGIDKNLFSRIKGRAEELKQECQESKITVRDQFGLDGMALIELLDIKKEQQKYLSALISHMNTEYQNNPALRKEDVIIFAKKWWEENVLALGA